MVDVFHAKKFKHLRKHFHKHLEQKLGLMTKDTKKGAFAH